MAKTKRADHTGISDSPATNTGCWSSKLVHQGAISGFAGLAVGLLAWASKLAAMSRAIYRITFWMAQTDGSQYSTPGAVGLGQQAGRH